MSKITKSTAVVGLLGLFTGLLVAFASPASAASCLTIYRIWYNTPGTDYRTNTALNGEWIQLHNGCRTTAVLTNWRIKDAANHTYLFGSYALGSGRYVKIHTGKGTNTATDRYWGAGNYVWNNDRDTGYLLNLHAALVDSCSYNNPHASYKYC